MKAFLPSKNKEMWIVKTLVSYGGILVYEAVDYDIALKYNFNVPPYISGLYYASQLMVVE